VKENVAILSAKIIQIGLVIIAFLIPVFFLPTTSEFYNFNKTTLLTVASFFLLAVWGVKMVAEGRVRITRTPLDLPLLIFLGAYILATIFSIDPILSVLGWHPVFFGSLPSVAAVVSLYFLASSHINSTYRQAIYAALAASASILALVAIVQYFGISILGTSWSAARSWTPAGDLNKLAPFLAVAVPFTISVAFIYRQTSTRYLYYALAVIQLLAFSLINSTLAYIPLLVAGLFALLFLPKLKFSSEEKSFFGVLVGVAVLVAVLTNISTFGNAILKPLINNEDKATSIAKPIRLPLSAAWQTSASS